MALGRSSSARTHEIVTERMKVLRTSGTHCTRRRGLLRGGLEEGDELEGISAGAVYGGGPVKVGAGDAAGGADFAEERAGVDEVAGLDGDGLEMAIEGVEAETVVEDHGVAGKIEGLGEDYAAALRGVNRSA